MMTTECRVSDLIDFEMDTRTTLAKIKEITETLTPEEAAKERLVNVIKEAEGKLKGITNFIRSIRIY